MGRRTPRAVIALLIVAIALTGTASAATARKHTRRARAHRCPATTRHHRHRRGRSCVTRKTRAAKPFKGRHGSKQPSSPSAATGGLVVGLNANAANWGGASAAGRLGAITRATGTKWLREDIEWAVVEPEPGVFDFSRYDHFMQLAAQRGEHILALLYDTPSWAGPAYNAIPSDPTAFAQYVAALVGRYGSGGTFWTQNPALNPAPITTWEVWNEPYLDTGDDGVYDPARYAELVRAAATAGRATDPNARFLLAAEMQSAMTGGAWQWWVDALYQAVPDLNDYFDGVAMHDYGDNTTTLNPIIPGQPYSNYGHIMRIEDLRRQFLGHGAADKPFWITEAGWSTCTDSPGCVTPAQQATNLATLFSDIHHDWSRFVQAAFIYSYGDVADASSTQGGYGLTYLNGAPKPALAVFHSQAVASAGQQSADRDVEQPSNKR
jgi:hypothetical protein